MEPPPGLPAEPPGVDVLPEQRAGPVAVVAEVAVEDLEDGEAGVEADEVGEGEGQGQVAHENQLSDICDARQAPIIFCWAAHWPGDDAAVECFIAPCASVIVAPPSPG